MLSEKPQMQVELAKSRLSGEMGFLRKHQF